jgi:hypothetical protein
MIPLVAMAAELAQLRALVDRVADEVFAREGRPSRTPWAR